MLHLDIPSREQVLSLIAARDAASVSIYLPTTPVTPDAAADRIALKNLAREAVRQIAAANAPRGAAEAVAEQLDDLAEDEGFWRVQARSLAVFVTPRRMRTFRLPNRLSPLVAVSERFHVKPLLRAVTFPQAAYVLALAAGSVRLIEVAPDVPPAEVRIAALPSDAASAVGKASIADRAPSGRIHGSEGQKVRLRQYARQVDRAVRDALHGSDTPLILAADETLGAIFRELASYPHLADEGIRESPETLTDAELAERARGVLDALYGAEIAAWRGRFAERMGQRRATTDTVAAARAATMGAIDSALVDIDAVVPGRYDPESGAVTIAETDDATQHGVIDAIVGQILATGGHVRAVRADEIPDGAPIAAILRYAVG